MTFNYKNENDVFAHYRGNLSWLAKGTLVLMKHGSHAYGTNTPTSDVDIKGVAVPPREVLLGFLEKFEQADKGWENIDCCIFSLPKFMGLAADNNPNMIELPFIDPKDIIYMDVFWRDIIDNRHLFLSQNCRHRFTGYAMAQLKRIRTHREWLLNPPKAPPVRADFGLPEYTPIPGDQRQAAESQIQKQIEAWNIDLASVEDGERIQLLNLIRDAQTEIASYSGCDIWTAAGRKLGFDDNFLEYLAQERGYRAASARWKQYQEWVRTRNPARAELEARHGYDTKHAMHLVRLMRMAKEILEGKGVIVRRPDAQELLAIRAGTWDFDKLMAWAEVQEKELEEIAKTSPLPKVPNRKELNAICVSIINQWGI